MKTARVLVLSVGLPLLGLAGILLAFIAVLGRIDDFLVPFAKKPE